ncbi:MAG: gluconate 2-dehydrogenase subunit 3 family protein [Leadbetterella sp.]
MNRREVISNLGIGALGLVSLPAWASGWNADKIGAIKAPIVVNQLTLSSIAETIIPETNTPGAKTLKISRFITKMISDVYTKEDQTKFSKGMLKIDSIATKLHKKPFAKLSGAQKIGILEDMGQSTDTDQKWFFETTKSLCILSYTTSEYYMVNIEKFEFAPARYSGCVALKN